MKDCTFSSRFYASWVQKMLRMFNSVGILQKISQLFSTNFGKKKFAQLCEIFCSERKISHEIFLNKIVQTVRIGTLFFEDVWRCESSYIKTCSFTLKKIRLWYSVYRCVPTDQLSGAYLPLKFEKKYAKWHPIIQVGTVRSMFVVCSVPYITYIFWILEYIAECIFLLLYA